MGAGIRLSILLIGLPLMHAKQVSADVPSKHPMETARPGTPAPAVKLGGVAPPAPRPAPIKPKKGQWPIVPWSYAKAYTYNFVPSGYRPDPPTLVSSSGAWNTDVRSEHLLTRDQALRVARLVTKTRGSYESSKCFFFPRHAVAYFDEQDRLAALMESCFECDDVSTWPDLEDPKSFRTSEGYFSEASGKAGDAALAGFKDLFGKELGQPVDWKDDAGRGQPAR